VKINACIQCCYEYLKERGHLEDLSVDGMIILGSQRNMTVWTGFFWLRIDTGSRLW
jgi:hypothetical protein